MGSSPLIRQRFWNAAGTAPLAGGKLYTYRAGTTTPQATYSDPDCTVPNTNPVILDSEGYADFWINSGSYKFILADANDVVQWTRDDITPRAPVGDIADEFDSPWVTHAITDGQSATELDGETIDFDDHSSVIYEVEVTRGTTIVANGRIYIENIDGTGQLKVGVFSSDPKVTFSIDQDGSVATLKAAATSGPGNGTIKLSKRKVPA